MQAGNNNRNYVGLKTNLRELAVHVFASRCDIAKRVDVRESLVLADDMLCHRIGLPCCGVGRTPEAP